MEKKLAVITGASKGIGRELVLSLASKNYDIVFTYNTSFKEAEELREYVINNYNVDIESIKCDISKEEDIINLKETILNKYNKIDVLINNAALSIDNSIEDKTKEEFMNVLEVNVVGTFLVTKYLNKYVSNMIINVSSTDSVDTYNLYNIDYSSSKAGINIITKTFALYNKDIKVIGVMPNWTSTEAVLEMNQEFLREEMNRINQKELENPKDVANNIVSLIDDETIISGEIIRV